MQCRCCGTTMFRDERTARQFAYRRARFFAVCGRSRWVPPYGSTDTDAARIIASLSNGVDLEVVELTGGSSRPSARTSSSPGFSLAHWTLCLRCFQPLLVGMSCPSCDDPAG